MNSNANYITCLRVLRQQLRYSRQACSTSFPPLSRPSRPFSQSPFLLSSQQTAENPSSPSPQKPVPSSQEENSPSTRPNVSFVRQTALKVAGKVRETAPVTTETYIAYGACDALLKECARQADYTMPQMERKDRGGILRSKNGEDLGVGKGWWYEVLGLPPTFNTWAQVTFLHMYLLTVRIRCFPSIQAPIWHQHLLDHFFYTAEDRMVLLHGMNARSVRNKYLKDLFTQWRGLLAGYDEGLAKGEDAVLATAVWRNVFGANEDVDLTSLAAIVGYMRDILAGLDQMGDDVLVTGEFKFGDPAGQLRDVQAQTRTMTTPVEGETQSGGGGSSSGRQIRAESKAGNDKKAIN